MVSDQIEYEVLEQMNSVFSTVALYAQQTYKRGGYTLQNKGWEDKLRCADQHASCRKGCVNSGFAGLL